MTKNVIVIDADENALEAAKLMRDRNIASLIVMKDNKPVGIVTERDFVRRICAEDRECRKISIIEIASVPLITIDPDASIEDAAEVMVKKKIRRLAVEKEKLIGILTATDLASYLAEERKEPLLLALARDMVSVGRRYIFDI